MPLQPRMTCLSTTLFMQFFVSANPSTTCCDSISRSVSDGSSGSQTAASSFCCPSYENRLLASTRTELNAALGMYSSPYAAAAAASQNYANYFPYSPDPSAIYSTLVCVLFNQIMQLSLIDRPLLTRTVIDCSCRFEVLQVPLNETVQIISINAFILKLLLFKRHL